MTDRVPIFVELCAGTAALSLRLHHPRARPPVSRMGAKTGYADVILRCMGLRPGQGADRYLWCEPDAGVRLLLHAYTDRELATAAADIIRSWKDEEPRALWERLRAEGPAQCPPVDAREVARWAWLAVRSRKANAENGFQIAHSPAQQGGPNYGPTTPAERLGDAPTLPATITDDARKVDPREVARWALLGWQSYRQGFPDSGFRATAGGSWPDRPPDGETVVNRLESAPTLPATIADDARKVDPREVARWLFQIGGSHQGMGTGIFGGNLIGWEGTEHGQGPKRPLLARLPDALNPLPTLPATIADDARSVDPREVARWALSRIWGNGGEPGVNQGWNGGYSGPGDGRDRSPVTIDSAAARFCDAPTLPATIADDARAIDPPQLPPGVVVYIDPPYLNTTGYAHAFPRSEWVPVVRRWREAGAMVVVSEAEPIPELMADGWHAVDITGERKGQKRTFSRQQAEWLTMSEPPRWRPSVQMGLWSRGSV